MSEHSYEPLSAWGWAPDWGPAWSAALPSCPRGLDLVPARVVGREGPRYLLETPVGPRSGPASGRLQNGAEARDLPLVGDWVAAQVVDSELAVIHAVLERRTLLSRAYSEKSKSIAVHESALAANLDLLGVVTGLDANFNPRRAQRLATLARHGGIQPVWILTKSDLPGADARVEEARRAAGSDPVIALSPLTGDGFGALDHWLVPGRSVGLAGSSGVGKTTLVGRMLGTDLRTTAVRSDAKGRHTTTSRHLYRLPSGVLLMDAPGFRTVGLWADGDDLAASFEDIEALARQCRFGDCTHSGEPGCAVQAALESGDLDPARWDGWQRQEREVRYLERRTDLAARRAEKERWRAVHQSMRHFSKEGRAGGQR